MTANGNVKCPVHGEHGLTANGKCWYCVQNGTTAAAPTQTRKVLSTSAKPARRVIA